MYIDCPCCGGLKGCGPGAECPLCGGAGRVHHLEAMQWKWDRLVEETAEMAEVSRAYRECFDHGKHRAAPGGGFACSCGKVWK